MPPPGIQESQKPAEGHQGEQSAHEELKSPEGSWTSPPELEGSASRCFSPRTGASTAQPTCSPVRRFLRARVAVEGVPVTESAAGWECKQDGKEVRPNPKGCT